MDEYQCKSQIVNKSKSYEPLWLLLLCSREKNGRMNEKYSLIISDENIGHTEHRIVRFNEWQLVVQTYAHMYSRTVVKSYRYSSCTHARRIHVNVGEGRCRKRRQRMNELCAKFIRDYEVSFTVHTAQWHHSICSFELFIAVYRTILFYYFLLFF